MVLYVSVCEKVEHHFLYDILISAGGIDSRISPVFHVFNNNNNYLLTPLGMMLGHDYYSLSGGTVRHA